MAGNMQNDMQNNRVTPGELENKDASSLSELASYPECHRFESYLSHSPGALEIRDSGFFMPWIRGQNGG